MLNGCTGEDVGHQSTYLYTYVSAREDAGQQRVPYVSTKPRRRNPPSSAQLKIKLPPANSTKATKLYPAPGKKTWKPGNFSGAWILWIPSFVNFRKEEPLVKILGERLAKGELGPALKLRWGKTSPQVLMVYLYVEDVRDPRQVSRVIQNAFTAMETGGSSTAYNQMLNKMVSLRPDRPDGCAAVWRFKDTGLQRALERVEPALATNASCDTFWADQEVKGSGRGSVVLKGGCDQYPPVKPRSRMVLAK